VTAPAAASRLRGVMSVGIGVAVCAGLVVLVLINHRLSWFALAGLAVGWAVGWLITQARHRRWRRFAIALSVIVVVPFVSAVVVALILLQSRERSGAPRAPAVTSVQMSSKMEYRSDKKAFEITDTMVLSDEASTAICISQLSGRGAQPGECAACEDTTAAAARDSCAGTALTALENAGWSYTRDHNGRPELSHSRQSAVDVPRWWPLSVTHSVRAPSVQLDNLLLVADENSTATIIGPKQFIRKTAPPKLSPPQPLLDQAGSEATKIPIGFDETENLDSSVRFELASSDARNPVVAPLLDFSWWGPAQWMVLLIAAIFIDQVKELIQWLFGSVARRAGWGKKPDAESKNTGQAAMAGPVGKADDGSPVGPGAAVGDPPSAAAGET
jgi:hypothetical protein